MRALYTLTIFVGSALLFLVQPLIAKQLLPIFGGSPLVWNTSLLFFQSMLLLGYLYAHFSIRWLGAQRQAVLHVLLVAMGLLVLPLHVPQALLAAYKHSLATAPNSFGASPGPILLAMLLVSVGLPFFALSAGAPTLQRWFAQTTDPNAKDPYFLYQASNLASMIALLGYPIWFERQFRLGEQSLYWSFGYGLLIALLGMCAFKLNRAEPVEVQHSEALKSEISVSDRAVWVFLAAGPTAMLGGLPTYLTTNVSPIPLLWVVPLSLYLMTFVVAFSSKLKRGHLFKYYATATIFGVVVLTLLGKSQPAVFIIPLHLIGFFFTGLACHYELAKSRPTTAHITEFYVWMSVGGMVGGLFSSLMAPILFVQPFEYFAAIALSFVAIGIAVRKEQPLNLLDLLYPAMAAGLVAIVERWGTGPHLYDWTYLALAAMCIFSLRPIRQGLLLVGFFVLYVANSVTSSNHIFQERSFFGILDVRSDVVGGVVFHRLVHGNTLHGGEMMSGPIKDKPTSYYSEFSGLGVAFSKLGNTSRFDNVAVVGLGTGTTAAYGRTGQSIDYYELDPHVESMARNPKLFTYVSNSRAQVKVSIGDARLRLKEAPDGHYGLIVLDAFSSDAIPIHLLTREAVQMYFQKLSPEGILAVHISNRYLNLEPVNSAIVQDLGLYAQRLVDTLPETVKSTEFHYPSRWDLISRNKAALDPVTTGDKRWGPLDPPKTRAWTDDYSNVLSAIVFDFPKPGRK